MRSLPKLLCIVAMFGLCAFAAGRAIAAESYGEVSAAMNTTSLQPGQQGVIAVVFDVKEGFHAQSHTPPDKDSVPLVVKVEPNPAFTASEPIYPAGEDHTYPALGKLNVYTGRVIVYVPIEMKSDAPTGPLKIKGSVHYQACDDNSCFQPLTPKFEIATKVAAAGEPSTLNQPELFKNFDPKALSKIGPATRGSTTVPAATQRSGAISWTIFGHEIGGNSYFLAFSVAILVGIIFNVMPCVLPVLPLKAIGFYETSQHHRGRCFLFGLTFSAGIVSTFGLLALLVLSGGQQWGQLFSHGWFVWSLTVILVLMALGMFGLFTFRLPVGVYSIEPSHDTYIGNFLFGILTAVLSTPCTAPLFPGLLTWAISQPRIIGVGIVIMVGVGMALPYLLLSAVPELARRMPRTGPWSELVKQMMGFLLIGVAGYFAGIRLLPGTSYIWIVFGVAVVAGLFLIARTAQLMPRAVPIAVSVIIAICLGGGAFTVARALTHEGPAWAPYSAKALADAQKQNRVVLVKFTANWCQNCQYVEATVYPDPKTLKALDQHAVVMLKADLTNEEAPGWELLRKLNPSGGIPLTAIYSPKQPDPTLLASIYTKQTLIDTLDKVTR